MKKGGERRKKAGKMMRKRGRRRMSRRLHKPGEGEGNGQGYTDSLWQRAMSLGLVGKMKGEQKGGVSYHQENKRGKTTNHIVGKTTLKADKSKSCTRFTHSKLSLQAENPFAI